MPTLYQVAVVALVTAFIVLLISRIGLRDFIIMRGYKLTSRLFGCDFCLCFWIAVFVSAILFLRINSPDLTFILLPICSTPIARYLL